MAEGSGFDMSKMSTAGKIIGGAGILYLLDLFLAWNKVCVGGEAAAFIGNFCGKVSGTHGLVVINLILVLVIIAMEVVILMGIEVNVGDPAMRAQIDAGLILAVLILTVLKVLLIDNDFLSWPAWLGLVLSIVMAYGGFMRFQEGKSAGGSMPDSGLSA